MKKIVKVFLLFDIFLILLFLFIRFYLPSFLICNNPTDSHVVVIESWISAFELERIANYLNSDQDAECIVVGKNYKTQENNIGEIAAGGFNNDDRFVGSEFAGRWLFANITLNFNLSDIPILQTGDSVSISVRAKGTDAAGYFPYFSVIINSGSEKGFFVNEEFNDYSFKIPIPEKGIQSIRLRFTNDVFTGNSDRNLNIHSIKIGSVEILATIENIKELEEQTKESTGFKSQPDEVAQYLVGLGADQNKITTLKFEPVEWNQTLASANTLKKYIEKTQITNLNVLSSGFHSRRTWLTYSKLLEPAVKVGLIYYPPVNYSQQNWYKSFSGYLYLLNEFFSYMVNWFSLSINN